MSGEKKRTCIAKTNTWVRGELTYLGVKFTSTVDGLYLANYIPLLNERKTDLKKNITRSLSWLGRINAFNHFHTGHLNTLLTRPIFSFQRSYTLNDNYSVMQHCTQMIELSFGGI